MTTLQSLEKVALVHARMAEYAALGQPFKLRHFYIECQINEDWLDKRPELKDAIKQLHFRLDNGRAKTAVVAAFRAYPNGSDEKIAKVSGVSSLTVARYRSLMGVPHPGQHRQRYEQSPLSEARHAEPPSDCIDRCVAVALGQMQRFRRKLTRENIAVICGVGIKGDSDLVDAVIDKLKQSPGVSVSVEPCHVMGERGCYTVKDSEVFRVIQREVAA